VEPGNGAAGDGDEEQGEERGGAFNMEVARRGHHGRVHHHDAEQEKDHGDAELEGIDIVPWLQQGGDREGGGDIGIDKKKNDPPADRRNAVYGG